MKFTTLLFFIPLSLLISCSAQSTKNEAKVDVLRVLVAKGDTVAKLGSKLWCVFQDKKANYWFGSDGEGVYRYNGKTIVNYTTKDGLFNNRIRQIQEDKLGNIYFSTLGGISKFDGTAFTTLQPIKSNDWKLDSTDLWFYGMGKADANGPCRYDGKTLYQLEFPKHYLHQEITQRINNATLSPYDIYTIYKDKKGHIWFGTANLGACKYDGKTVKWLYEEELTTVPAGGSFGIRSIFEDKEGKFWICNTNQRFVFNNEKTDKSDRLQYQKIKGIGNEKVFNGEKYIYYSHIVEDSNKNIWLTTWKNGVFKYDGKKITNFPIKDGEKSVNIISLYKDNKGVLWVGTMDNGTFKFNGKRFEKFMP